MEKGIKSEEFLLSHSNVNQCREAMLHLFEGCKEFADKGLMLFDMRLANLGGSTRKRQMGNETY